MPIVVNPVQDSAELPAKVDVVVIGAGIVGTSTAYELARKGVSVALVEKGIVAGEQSGRNWGWVRQQNRDFHELPLAMHSLKRWGEIDAEIGADLGFRRIGCLYASKDADELARWDAWSRKAREMGFYNETLTAAETQERMKGSTTKWVGAIWSPTDGCAEPGMAAPAIATGAKALGASIHQNCAVRGLDIANGAVKGVWTERGLIKAEAVVLAGGAWSSRFLRRHGIDLPVANVEGTALRTTPAPNVVEAGCVTGAGYALRRRLDGSYTIAVPGHGVVNLAPQGILYATKFREMMRAKIGKKLKYRLNGRFFNGPDALGGWDFDKISPFEKIRIMDPAPQKDLVKEAIDSLVADFPVFKGIEVAASWAGLIDTSPDLVPVIANPDAVRGLTLATGFSGHGFALGPGAGRLASEMAMNETPFVEINPFRLSRFFDGSAIKRPEMM
ncbi:MAG: FAD-binding oxidoreductase [Fulvimarina manganoxydans]|uniref:NAD(P)/FAD-dependent oxidoreductase n=1 Tax=Fulvimarina manganoxydans TaxID=937218 RepID=UPI002357DACE|nr:FAD-binding oxidoreductase [Fulvimarina manganoxydans]MCK5931970.1 FAD-binding oxidoreductase [Fulvimarina manganoxydans]